MSAVTVPAAGDRRAPRATLTRAAPLDPVLRRFLIVICAALVAIFAALTANAWVQLSATLGNRSVGNDLRRIDCTILGAVAPDKVLAECPADPLATPDPKE